MLILIALLLASIQPANTAQRITVAQLEDKLNAPVDAPPPHGDLPLVLLQDANLAFQIDRLQLSERLTSTTLDAILAHRTFGPQTQQALRLLSDR